jgi:hypothetical protein
MKITGGHSELHDTVYPATMSNHQSSSKSAEYKAELVGSEKSFIGTAIPTVWKFGTFSPSI